MLRTKVDKSGFIDERGAQVMQEVHTVFCDTGRVAYSISVNGREIAHRVVLEQGQSIVIDAIRAEGGGR